MCSGGGPRVKRRGEPCPTRPRTNASAVGRDRQRRGIASGRWNELAPAPLRCRSSYSIGQVCLVVLGLPFAIFGQPSLSHVILSTSTRRPPGPAVPCAFAAHA